MSEIRVTTLSDPAGTGPVDFTGQVAAKAYAHINQIGTQTVVGSFNVTSITDQGVGRTVVTLTNAFSALTYALSSDAQAPAAGASTSADGNRIWPVGIVSTSSVAGAATQANGGAPGDLGQVNVTAWGTLA